MINELYKLASYHRQNHFGYQILFNFPFIMLFVLRKCTLLSFKEFSFKNNAAHKILSFNNN